MMMAGHTKLLLISAIALVMTGGASAAPKPQPNIVVIMTDDQSDLLDDTSRAVMPKLNELLIDKGNRFVNYFVTTPICCPSRVSWFRGQYTHNHNYTDVLGTDAGGVAGYPKFKELQVDHSYLPTWLQSLGYNTYYTGKFLVDYNTRNYNDTPKGWTDIDALVTPYLFQYYDPVFSRNGQKPAEYKGQYTTDVIADKVLAQIVSAVSTGKPFYLQSSQVAPHFSSGGPTSPKANETAGIVPGDISVARYPPIPAPRHWNLFSDLAVPKPLGSFNEPDVSDKPSWVRGQPRLSTANITYLEEIYRLRLRSLRAVDELIDRVVKQLDQLGVLNNTYIIYTSDNGYHLGTHRRPSGKLSAYEEDIRVPFIIRGPGLAEGQTVLQQAAHVDVAPTLIALAGGVAPEEVDGSPLPLVVADGESLPESYPDTAAEDAPTRTQLPFTYYQGGNGDFDEYFNNSGYKQNLDKWTWKAIRVHNPNSEPAEESDPDADTFRQFPRQDGWKYAVICTNERELYNLRSDPYEARNVYTKNQGNKRLVNRLDALFQLLQTCWGDSCRHPFKYLHNDTTTPVKHLWAALSSQYDQLYSKIPKFEFKSCQRYQDYENEVNYFKPIIGTFPRGPDGLSLKEVDIQPYVAPTTPSRKKAQRKLMAKARATSRLFETPFTAVAEVEKYAVPLSDDRLHLTNEQLYGPKGSSVYLA